MTREEVASWNGWFGESWGAPICEPDNHHLTPVGAPCLECGVAIADGDQGVSMPHVTDDGVAIRFQHLDCFLQRAIGHGPNCPRCRGLERHQHKMSCSYAKHGGECDCPWGEQMRRLMDPKTTLAELENIAESMGISRRELEDIGRRGVEHVERLKRIRAIKQRAHKPGHDPGNGEV